MAILNNNTGLFTDQYEFTMAQGYFLSGNQEKKAVFDYFFRKNPFKGGFVVFAGLADLLSAIENYCFEPEDCRFLESIGFDKKFTGYLKGFRFIGNVYSVREGEIIFPNETVLRVEGNIIETQLIESLLLNLLNFQSLIATKAARIRLIAGERLLLDFGLRRAQGLGAVHASRAAIIGGFNGTSNLFSAKQFGLTSSGTMAHSFVQTFNSELEAFREFVRINPGSAILLVDTYDTLRMGIPNAITVAKEMEAQGGKLLGIRLDSGDLAYLSKAARRMLDRAGLKYVKIAVSNQLDEYVIRSLLEQQAPVDAFGVGTVMITGQNDAALDGVYKLSEIDGRPRMKVSENLTKMTLPGKKNLCRYMTPDDRIFFADGLELYAAGYPEIIYHPFQTEKHIVLKDLDRHNIMETVMENGKTIRNETSVEAIAVYVHKRLDQLPEEYKRLENPHIYKVGIGKELMNLRNDLKEKLWKHSS